MVGLVDLQIEPAGFVGSFGIGDIPPTARPVIKGLLHELFDTSVGIQVGAKVKGTAVWIWGTRRA